MTMCVNCGGEITDQHGPVGEIGGGFAHRERVECIKSLRRRLDAMAVDVMVAKQYLAPPPAEPDPDALSGLELWKRVTVEIEDNDSLAGTFPWRDLGSLERSMRYKWGCRRQINSFYIGWTPLDGGEYWSCEARLRTDDLPTIYARLAIKAVRAIKAMRAKDQP